MIGSLRCRLGRHAWERRANPEIAGKDAVFYVCRRCQHERNEYVELSTDEVTGRVGGSSPAGM